MRYIEDFAGFTFGLLPDLDKVLYLGKSQAKMTAVLIFLTTTNSELQNVKSFTRTKIVKPDFREAPF